MELYILLDMLVFILTHIFGYKAIVQFVLMKIRKTKKIYYDSYYSTMKFQAVPVCFVSFRCSYAKGENHG